jgi:4Fe-4S ferredoxin
MAFVYRLQRGEKKPDACPPLLEPRFSSQLDELRRLLAPLEKASKTGILIDENKCTGCGVCVEMCPVNQAEEPMTSFGREPADRDKLVLAMRNLLPRTSNILPVIISEQASPPDGELRNTITYLM